MVKKKPNPTPNPKNLSSQNQSALGYIIISWPVFAPQTQRSLTAVERKMTLPEPPAEPVTVLDLPLDPDFKDTSLFGHLSYTPRYKQYKSPLPFSNCSKIIKFGIIYIDTEQHSMPHSRAQNYSLQEAHLLVLSIS